MTVGDIMTEKVVTVQMDDSLEIIKDIFEVSQFHHLIVEELHSMVGVISDRDFLKVINSILGTSSSDKDLLCRKKARHIMSKKLVKASKAMSVEEAVKLLLKNNISCLPVVGPLGELEGIVSWKDLFKAYLKN